MSIEGRLEKLEASKPVDARAEADILLRRVHRVCARIPENEWDAKMAAMFRFVSDEVLQIIADMKDDDGSGDETPDLPPLPPTVSLPTQSLSLQESNHE